MIAPHLYESLPQEERRLWHSHVYEVKSGMLVMPNRTVPATVWDAAERKEMEEVITLYGKTYHLWQTDRGDKLPLGEPKLMTSFTADGQLDAITMKQRDEKFGISCKDKKASRADIKSPKIHPGECFFTSFFPPDLYPLFFVSLIHFPYPVLYLSFYFSLLLLWDIFPSFSGAKDVQELHADFAQTRTLLGRANVKSVFTIVLERRWRLRNLRYLPRFSLRSYSLPYERGTSREVGLRSCYPPPFSADHFSGAIIPQSARISQHVGERGYISRCFETPDRDLFALLVSHWFVIGRYANRKSLGVVHRRLGSSRLHAAGVASSNV